MDYFSVSDALTSSLFQAICVAIVSAYFTVKVKEYSERKKTDKELRFDLYMRLMDLNTHYGFLAGYEIRGQECPHKMEEKVALDRFHVSDLARKIDASDLKEILQILFLEKYTYRERYHETTRIIDTFGYELAPKFKKIMRDITKENEEYLLSRFK